MVPWLGPRDPFPAVERALREPNGLLAVGRSLTTATLLEAYASGIFPWFNEGEPILWWSPDPRMILLPDELHVSHRLARRMRQPDFTVTLDTAFPAVMRACAEPREGQDGTWITRSMLQAYTALHAAGAAHSVETWMDGQLAGGLYGVSIGRAFFGESMFTRRTDASKIAFVTLVRRLERWGFQIIDCQLKTAHLATFGAREIPRSEFLARVRKAVLEPPPPVPWRLE
jgi:leucyl/phenylalanyl-tRNA--protein transferase